MNNVPITLEQIEVMCASARLRPVKRMRLREYELVVADGESKPPHFRFQRFLDPADFPNGCLVTMWWLLEGEKRMVHAEPMFLEKDHESYLTDDGRLKSRINRAAARAVEFLEMRDRARKGLIHA